MEIGIDLSHMLTRGYTASQVEKVHVTWWHLFNAGTCESVRPMIHGAGTPSKAWRCLNEHYSSLSAIVKSMFGSTTRSLEDETG